VAKNARSRIGCLLDLGRSVAGKLERNEAATVYRQLIQLLNRSRMPWARKLNELSIRRRGPWPWLVALSLYGAALAVRLMFAPLLEGMKFLTFYPAVAAVTLVCGWPQGLVVLVLSTVTAWYLFFTPVRSFDVPDVNTAGALVGFLIVGGLRLNLLINDDGPGLAPQAVDANVKSLGIGLMEAFATQLGGSLKIAGSEGASLSVAFETGRAA